MVHCAHCGALMRNLLVTASPSSNIRLVGVSAQGSGRTAAVLIESTEPVAYAVSRPDPLTVLRHHADHTHPWFSGTGNNLTFAASIAYYTLLSFFPFLLLIISLLSIVYGSVQAFTQTNLRLILGYSSIAQLGFITLGIFAFDDAAKGAQGALLQAVNHGLVVAPLFFIVLLLSERAGGSEDIRDMGGLGMRAPALASLFLIVAFATLAMPGSSNFVGEFYILLGVFTEKIVIAIVATAGVVMGLVVGIIVVAIVSGCGSACSRPARSSG